MDPEPSTGQHATAGIGREPARRALPTGTVTFLFSDLEGSTGHLQATGDAAYAAALAAHRGAMRRAFAAHAGIEVDTQGDAFLAAFGSAAEAVLAAVDAQRANPQDGPPVRIGLHTGEPLLTAEGYVGIDVHQGARIASASHGGQIVVSARTAAAAASGVPDNVAFRDLGLHRLKDLREPQPLLQVLAPGLRDRFPPLRTLDARAHNLPVQLTALIGREDELATAHQLLASHRLVTLTGTGGTGKTRLALQIGADLIEAQDDGVWFVDLAPLVDPSLVPAEVARALGVREEAARPIVETVMQWARDRRLLVILDNCEHLIDASARLVDDLLKAAPGVRVLATSREPLGVLGEAVRRLPSLALPDREAIDSLAETELLAFDAVQLFVERANAQRPGAVAGASALRAAAHICRRLDGIPLAIELAAARARGLAVEEIADRLDDRFRLLTAGARSLLPRQQTLRALVDWSYDLLPEPERRLFERLAVFAGAFELDLVEAVCADTEIPRAAVMDLLLRLADKSLVAIEATGMRTRYRMLDTLRAYAAERLAARDEVEAWATRHLEAFVRRAELGEGTTPSAQKHAAWLGDVADHLDEVRAAMAFALRHQPIAALRLTAALGDLWVSRGHLTEGREALDAALEAAADAPATLYARALAVRARIAVAQSRYDAAIEDGTRAAGLGEAADDPNTVRTALVSRGLAYWERGVLDAAERDFTTVLGIARAIGNDSAAGAALNNLGILALSVGRPEDALGRYQEAATQFRALGEVALLGPVLNNIAVAAEQLGDLGTAVGAAREAAEIGRQSGDRSLLGYALLTVAHLELALGETPAAKRDIAASLTELEAQGVARAIAYALEYAALAAEAEDRAGTALELFGASEALRARIKSPRSADEQRELETAYQAASAASGPAGADAALARGRAMSMEEAMAAARRALDSPPAGTRSHEPRPMR